MSQKINTLVELGKHHDLLYKLHVLCGRTRAEVAKDLNASRHVVDSYCNLHKLQYVSPYPYIDSIKMYHFYRGEYDHENYDLVFITRKSQSAVIMMDIEFFQHLVDNIGEETMERIVNEFR